MPTSRQQSAQPELELRCHCRYHPILAKYWVEPDGELTVSIRSWKQNRLFVNAKITGEARMVLQCRDCYRYHRITFPKGGKAKLEELPAGSVDRM